ncbi:MAG: hypothetical protein A2991_03030 [Candidatus Terrybacteria bacterium RIFCSPLOWO2_01_FULL_58_14]|uniref:Signal transduction histidine-protein kinase/phosphatase MprB n=2 Tax=Candidatus Terryibacteriota TaxID=1817920 RepID=A0A1G2PXP7_9BACT|nr:MAG: hypothetical protein A2682_02945 [Candidatus Terrybacteria bacterium RIFCSPHIGHO2_01_FULL_58_15]OHA52372.1 MAG: hypothetical protein A2991_03030 [Candidatus Terrybacteria bacterium RIFCSPLOWO2_01_FULL_58_14]
MEKNRVLRTTIFRKVFSRLVLAGLVPLLAMGTVGIAFLVFSLWESNAELERTVLMQKRTEVERLFAELLETFSVYVGYEEELPVRLEDQRFFLEGILRDQPMLAELSILQTIPVLEGASVGEETFRLARNGDLLASRLRADDPAFVAAASGKTFIGETRWEDGQPFAAVSGPIKNRGGRFIGVLAGELSLTKVQTYFRGASFGGSGAVYLLDEQNRVLAHSGGDTQVFRDASAVAFPLDEATIGAGLDGATVFASTIAMSRPPWRLGAEWPLQDAFAELRNLGGQIILLAVLLVGALVLLANRQSREVAGPIRLLEAAAARIGRGEFGASAEVRTGDELEELGAVLHRMAQDLSRFQQVRAAEIRAQAFTGAMVKEHELAEAKDFILTTASHQFRTPISALSWSAGVLKRMALPDEARVLLEGIEEHSMNLGVIVTDLLNAAAFGPGYLLADDAGPVALDGIVKEAVERLHPLGERKGIRFILDISPGERLLVRGSAFALRIAAEHLIANAITYTPAGGEVRVALSRIPQGVLQFSVRDTGIGIPKEEQVHLFSSFFRASNAIEAKNVGTGLGLFIVHNIVAGHGGSVSCVSERGKGTECTVTLPLQEKP